jgi:dipeptidyl aminopeptidase/acylaminoacyl peptidase
VNESTDDLSISARPAALILYSGTVNTIEAWCENLMGNRRNEIWSISPFHNLKPGMPPTLGFHGREDCTVRIYSIFFFLDKAKELGNDVEYVILDEKKHLLDESNDKYSRYFNEEILEKADTFLKTHGLTPE